MSARRRSGASTTSATRWKRVPAAAMHSEEMAAKPPRSLDRSSSTTRCPRSAAAIAATMPAVPPPTTMSPACSTRAPAAIARRLAGACRRCQGSSSAWMMLPAVCKSPGESHNRCVRRWREAGRWGIRLAISLGIVGYILYSVDREHLWHAVTVVRLQWVAVAVVIYLIGQLLSAYKWFLLGRSVGLAGSPVDYGRFYLIGMFFNLLGISTLGGDVVRGLYLGRGHRPGLALNSVLFDRVSGLAVLMALCSVTLLAHPEYQFAGPIGLLVTIGGGALIVGWWTCPYLVKLLPAGNRIRCQVETELAPFWRDSWLLVRVVCVSLVFHLSQVCV